MIINTQKSVDKLVITTYLMSNNLLPQDKERQQRINLHNPKVARKCAPVETGCRIPNDPRYRDDDPDESESSNIRPKEAMPRRN